DAFPRPAVARDPPESDPFGYALEVPLSHVLAVEVILDDLPRGAADRERPWFTFRLDASGDVRRVAQGQAILAVARPDRAHDDSARVRPQPHVEGDFGWE